VFKGPIFKGEEGRVAPPIKDSGSGSGGGEGKEKVLNECKERSLVGVSSDFFFQFKH